MGTDSAVRGRPAGQHTVRAHNLALALAEIAAGPVTRARIAGSTGLTRGTVSSLVEELIAAGLVTELAPTRGATGRPANPVTLDPAGPAGVGVEIGVDHVAACVVDLTGRVRATRRAASDHRDQPPTAGLGHAADLVAEVVAEAGLPVAGVGAALPGIVTPAGVLLRAPNLPRWEDVEIATAVAAALRPTVGTVPVTVGNEADLAALAELWCGGPADFLRVSGGVGVGAGIVLSGALFRGASGRAGELGHVVVDPDGPPCSCGGRGCLEQAAGAAAMLRCAGVGDLDALIARPGAALDVAGAALGVALAGAVNLLDVPVVVLGGLFAQLGEGLADRVRAQLRERVVASPAVRVHRSVLGPDAALRGAATSVVRAVLAAP